MINPGTRDSWIGVLGGGQLGRMLCLEARRMGYKVLQWTGGDVSGAAYLADLVLEAPFEAAAALDRFVHRVRVATVEFENIPGDLLEEIGRTLPVRPGAGAVTTCQNREREKTFLAAHGIPCADFHVVSSCQELEAGLQAIGGAAMLKTAEFGYDGKGQRVISGETPAEDLPALWADFGAGRAVLEEKVDLKAELSVLVARGPEGQVVTYDPAENQHCNQILDISIVPARLPDGVLSEAREIAVSIAEAFEYVGVLAVEFFLAGDGRLLVNELAPRPHNSGHHTLDACATSQFEQQLRAVSGLPLGDTTLLAPAVMWNLLGDLWIDEATPPDWSPVLGTPGAKLHLYGKTQARPGRKMGHVTFLGATREEALERASACRRAFGLPPVE